MAFPVRERQPSTDLRRRIDMDGIGDVMGRCSLKACKTQGGWRLGKRMCRVGCGWER